MSDSNAPRAARREAGLSLTIVGVLMLVTTLGSIVHPSPAWGLTDPDHSNKELLCHSVGGEDFQRLSVNKSSVEQAHPSDSHVYDIVEGRYSNSLGRIAVAADIATILGDGTIVWLCGDSTATTTTTTTLAPTTTTTTIPETTTTLAPTTTTSTLGTTTTTVGTTTTTVAVTTTTYSVIGGPQLPTTTTTTENTHETKPDSGPGTELGGPELPRTGGADLTGILAAGLALLLAGVGLLMVNSSVDTEKGPLD
jgi:LPXTG-motif cell wall-anchored protein